MSKRLLLTATAAISIGLVCGGCSKKSRSYTTNTSTTAVSSGDTTSTGSSTSPATSSTAPVATSATSAPPPVAARGSGMFSDLSLGLPESSSQDWTVAAGDFDGDGTQDLAIGVYDGTARLLLNAKGVFSEKPAAIPPVAMKATDMHAVDIDGDKDLDLVVACNFQPLRVFTNDGQGSFTLSQEVVTNNGCFTYKIAIGDIDEDGDPDVFMANAGQYTPTRGQNILLLNDGAGKLAPAPAGAVPALTDDSIGVVMLDVNGDTYLDVFVANFGTQHRMLVNDKQGKLLDQSDVYLPPGLITYGTCAAAADFDRDGRIDIFVGNEGAPLNGLPPGGERNLLLRQTAGGRFVDDATRLPTNANATFNVRAVDVDGDGWVDLVVSNLRAEMRLLQNQTGVFVDASARLTAANTPAESLGLAVFDADGDTVPDVIFVRRGEKPLLLRNLPVAGAGAAAAAAKGPTAGAP